MASEIYADAIKAVSIAGGTVRIDFASHQITDEAVTGSEGAGGRPPLVTRLRVTMTAESFAHAVSMLDQASRKLIDDAQAKTAPSRSTAKAPPVSPDSQAGEPAPPRASPNFT